jgi:hypothetical protein
MRDLTLLSLSLSRKHTPKQLMQLILIHILKNKTSRTRTQEITAKHLEKSFALDASESYGSDDR